MSDDTQNEFANSVEKSEIEAIRAIHGWSLLAARDASDPDQASNYLAAADAMSRVLAVIDDGWLPFEDGDLATHYADVSKAVERADRKQTDSAGRKSGIGLE